MTDPGYTDKPVRELVGVMVASAMAIFMVNLDVTVVNIILPELCGRFEATTSQASWVVLSYMLAVTGLSLVFGRLSDMKGGERLFMGGYFLFAVGSGVCALSWNLLSLSLFRFLQGVGGAMIMATCAVMVVRYIPQKMRGRAFALNGMMAGLGFALGSPVGGFLSHYFDWRAVFVVNIPVAAVGLFFCRRFLTRRDHVGAHASFDIAGALTGFLMLGTLIFSLHGLTGESSHLAYAGLGLTLVLAVVFVRHELRCSDPLLSMSLFGNRALDFALLGTGFYYVLLQGTGLVLPFFLIHARGMTEAHAGALLFAGPVTTIVLAPLVGWLCDKVGPRLPALFGAILFAISCSLFLNFSADSSVLSLLVALVLLGIGMSFYSAPILTLTMSFSRPETVGVLSSVKSVVPSVIGMLGYSIYSLVYSANSVAPNTASTGFHHAAWLAVATAGACLVCTLFTAKRHLQKLN